MLSKNAVGNLRSRYLAVLKKCQLKNVFGSLAVASMLCASIASPAIALENPSGDTIASMNANNVNQSTPTIIIGSNDTTLINSGTILGGHDYRGTTTGMYGYENSTTKNFIFNNNDNAKIDVKVTTGDASGMYASGTGNHELTNHANATITATTNDGSAHGMYVSANGNHKLSNSTGATITATVNDGTAYGMYVNGGGNHTLINEQGATITATANRYNSHAMEATGLGNNTLINNGTINASSQQTYAIAMTAGQPSILGNYTLINNGTINVNAQGTLVRGLSVSGIGNHTLTNTGTINVSAQAANSFAVGMRVGSGSATFTNSGTINVSAPNGYAFEVFGSTSYKVGDYTTTLKEWTPNNTVFAVANNGAVNFENSTITLRPSSTNILDFIGKEYDLAHMVAIDIDPDPAVYNFQFADSLTGTSNQIILPKLKTEVPYLDLVVSGGNNSGKVKIGFNDELPVKKLGLQAVKNHQSQFNKISGLLAKGATDKFISNKTSVQTGINTPEVKLDTDNLFASNSQIISDLNSGIFVASAESSKALDDNAKSQKNNMMESKWTVFATPYIGFTDNSEYNYDANTYGLSAGAQYSVSPKFDLGFHVDFNYVDASGSNLDNESTNFAIGAHANYFVTKNLYLRGQATVSFGQNDFDYKTSIGTASDDYSSTSLYAGLNAGYIFEINENNIITPEIGLSYVYSDIGGYNVHFNAPYDVYNLGVKGTDHDALFASFMLNWQGTFAINSEAKGYLGTISPSLGIGIRQNLFDGDIDSSFSGFGSKYSSSSETDETVFLANAGLEWTSGMFNQFTLGAYYDGAYGSDEINHAGSIKFMYKF